MKALNRLILLTFLLVFISGCRNEITRATLNIKLDLLNQADSEYPRIEKLTITKDGKFFKEYTTNKYAPYLAGSIRLDSLSKGTYEIGYPNYFGQYLKKSISINASNQYQLTMYADSIDFSKNVARPIINRLKPVDSLTIHFASIGCLHLRKDSLIIQKTNHSYLLKYLGQVKPLNPQQVKNLIQFESELYTISGRGFCTTTDSYTICFQGHRQTLFDSSCSWNGWMNLKKKLEL